MIVIDTDKRTISVDVGEGTRTLPYASAEAFELLSEVWLNVGWDVKHVYSFTWMGRPIIQLPEDMVRVQEVIYRLRPDVIIETGVAHGGSLIFYASLLEAIGRGRVIGVDIEIRPHNRIAIEAHDMFRLIDLIEGGSTAAETVSLVRSMLKPDDTVMVLLDSNHTRDHVLEELRLYAPMVTPGSYIVATDGIMAQVVGGPRTNPDWSWNNPLGAIDAFLADTPAFVAEEPGWLFNESLVRERVTYWPRAYLRRK